MESLEEALDHYYIIHIMVVMVERQLECQEKVNNLLVRSFQIILTNTETLPCKISREQTIDSDTFSEKKKRNETQFYAKFKNFPDHQIIYRDMKTYSDKICEKRKQN